MEYQHEGRKAKVTLTLSPWIVKNLDRLAAQFKIKSRSELTESVLSEWLKIQAKNKLNEETAAYYASLTTQEKEEDKAWGWIAAKSARSLWKE
jgi:metal-responsive CopG/Arc/MetJ family transcriptional regulator